MKASRLDKVQVKHEESLSVPAAAAHGGRSTRLYPPPFFGREWARTHQRKPCIEKRRGGVFPPVPLKPRTTQVGEPKNSEIKRVLCASSALLYAKVGYLQAFGSGYTIFTATPSLRLPTTVGSHYTLYTSQTLHFPHLFCTRAAAPKRPYGASYKYTSYTLSKGCQCRPYAVRFNRKLVNTQVHINW